MGRRFRSNALRAYAVTLIDTSAWIEFLRNTGSEACILVDKLLAHEPVICDVVRMEVLAGARDESHLLMLHSLLARAKVIPILSEDYDNAAALYRHCRRQGETVRKLVDCLIASVAIRAGIPILHNDADFDALARHTGLRVYVNAD